MGPAGSTSRVQDTNPGQLKGLRLCSGVGPGMAGRRSPCRGTLSGVPGSAGHMIRFGGQVEAGTQLHGGPWRAG